MTSRLTRSRTRAHHDAQGNVFDDQATSSTPVSTYPRLKVPTVAANVLTIQQLDGQLSRLPKDDLALLRIKQQKLEDGNAQVPSFIRAYSDSVRPVDLALAQAAAATLIFAWEAAGTAVCISPEGLLLTCSHCIAESEDEYEPQKERWLLFARGHAVRAKCVAWDPVRDLALLQITAASTSNFPYMHPATTPPAPRIALLCVGHPGSEDFEADTSGIETGYDVLHISEGKFRGLAKGQDPQDNSDIGALMHDCWTYWGHSGAPLISKRSGELVGLHSSWDDETAMRRGVAWDAITAFLAEYTTQSLIA